MLEYIKVICALCCATLGIALVFPLMPWSEQVASLTFANSWTMAPWLVAASLAIAAWVLPKSKEASLPWSRTKAFYLGIGLLCLLHPLIYTLILAWAGWRPAPESIEFVWPSIPEERSFSQWLYLLTVFVALPAISEEWFFRGKLLPWLGEKLGIFSAISLSSLWFAAVHGSILTICIALPFGIFLALLFQRTGSLYACITAHACHNFLMLGLGGLLVARPDLALILFVLGTWMVFSVFSRQLFAPKRRLLALTIIPVVILSLHGPYRLGHLELWLWGAERHLKRVPPHILLPRLDDAARINVLTPGRGIHLANQLLEKPQSSLHHWWWLLAATDPTTAAHHALS
jgi:membrane protease YdiL (CAAX protease family)